MCLRGPRVSCQAQNAKPGTLDGQSTYAWPVVEQPLQLVPATAVKACVVDKLKLNHWGVPELPCVQ